MTQQPITQRTIVVGQSTTKLVVVDTTMPLHTWLAAQTSAHDIQLRWLLAHGDSGVVWGEQRGDELALSVSSLVMNWNTLHQARLFGEEGELLVWQGPQGWQARLIHDGSGHASEWIDERQMLWGNRPADSTNSNPGFTAITEGSQGITHAPPIGNTTPTDRQRACLLVRHYLSEDDAGVARISGSRVVRLRSGERQ